MLSSTENTWRLIPVPRFARVAFHEGIVRLSAVAIRIETITEIVHPGLRDHLA
jgi:hypothetical protein